MSILNGFIPLPNWYITRGFTLKLTHRERVLYFTIGVEVFRFPESRETMSKEMTTRGLQAITGINHSHIARILNKFQRMGIITVLKSFTKGISSKVAILAPDKLVAEIATNNDKSVAKKATNSKKSVAKKATYLITQYKKEYQESIFDSSDSSLNIEIEQSIKEKPTTTKPSLNSIKKDKQLAINLLCPDGGATTTGNNEFTPLGSILPAIENITAPPVPILPDPVPQVTAPSMIISPSVIEEGKKVLSSKGFRPEEVKDIVNRITGSMSGKDINNLNGYFISACNKEVKKSSNSAGSVHKVTAAALPAQKKNTFTEIVNRWEEEKDENFEEILKGLMKSHPEEIYEIVQTIENSPLAKWIPSVPSIRAGYYVREYRMKYSMV